MLLLISIIQQGLIFSLVAMAVYVTSRVINKDDLSVEGSFGLGGALSALLLVNGVSPLLATSAAMALGGIAGGLTGILFTRLKMNHLMAGLVTTTACFSVSLAIASANKNVPSANTIFAYWHASDAMSETVVLVIIVGVTFAALVLFFRSQIGLLLRACGDNPSLLVHFGKSANLYHVLGFILANALTALGGSLFVQWSGFFSITGNIGTLITGLASLMLAELFYKKLSPMIVLAAIAYQSVFSLTLIIGLAPSWNNLVKALIMIALVVLSMAFKKRASRGIHA